MGIAPKNMLAPTAISASFAAMLDAKPVAPPTGGAMDALPISSVYPIRFACMKKSMQAAGMNRRYSYSETPAENELSPALGFKKLLYRLPLVCLCWILFFPEAAFAGPKVRFTGKMECSLGDDDLVLWKNFLRQELPAGFIDDPVQRSIFNAYQQREWRPFFFDSGFGLNRDAISFITKLENLTGEAVNPTPFQLEEIQQRIIKIDGLCMGSQDTQQGSVLVSGSGRNQSSGPGPDTLIKHQIHLVYQETSALDFELIKKLLLYAKEMNPYCSQDVQRALSGEITIAELLQELEPKSPHYATVREALAKYQDITRKHPFRALQLPKLQLGSQGLSVRQLQERLIQEGYYGGKVNGVFDSATREAVKEFQRAHQLKPDGVVGAQTTISLNQSWDQKRDMIAFSLQLLRKSQARRFDKLIRINIPQYILEYQKNDQIDKTYRVIVGKSSGKRVRMQGRSVGVNHTPTLVSAVQQIIFNPRWYVTERIRLELNDQVRADPSYFFRNGYVAMNKSYSWGDPRLYQKPGPTNPLGRVKFEFPNRYTVYLHDTPKRQLFDQERRDFSHGCIRLDQALDFAELLLADEANPEAARIEQLIAGNRQKFVQLKQPVPIIIEYIPVSSDGQGQVVFCGDPYGWFLNDHKSQS
jgi:L,D-transpeptidase YcbB